MFDVKSTQVWGGTPRSGVSHGFGSVSGLARPARSAGISTSPRARRRPTWSNAGYETLTDKALTQTSFDSLDDLIDSLEEWAAKWSEDPNSYEWTKPAAEITRAREAPTQFRCTHRVGSAHAP